MRTLATMAICLILSGLAIGQETTTPDELRAVLEDIRDWPPDYDGMDSRLADAVKKGGSQTRESFKQSGNINSVEFIESFRGVDLYYVRFEENRWFVGFTRGEDGKISRLRYRIVAR